MTRRPALILLAAALAAGCGRGRPPGTAATPVAADSVTAAAMRYEAERIRADSVRRALEAPKPPPLESPPPPPVREQSAVTEPAPERRCVLDLLNTPDTRAQRIQDPSSKKYYTYVGGGLHGRCRGQDITIDADSAESYEVNDLHILIGRVKYREARYAIDADRVTYFRAEERLLFQDNVHAVMPSNGATLDAVQLEYFRAVRGIRDRARIVAHMRPRLTYVERDSAGVEQPPVFVLANTIIGEGDSTFHAVGQVRLERTDVLATADSAVLDANHRFARLMNQPVIESRGERPFTLRGRVVDLFGTARQVDRVLAIDSARAVSADFNLQADTIDLRTRDRRLQRAFAFGTSGATAITPGRDILADSLDIVMPDQRIRELRAIGKAWAESDPDTTRIRSDERDWIRGDTLIASFDSVAQGDTATPRLRDLFASGEASAYYQVADSANPARPGINYITGRVIRLGFSDGEVQTVSVTDQVRGVYLVPLPADTAAAARPRPPAPAPPAATRRPPGLRPGRLR